MFMEFAWNTFINTGILESYLFFKEIEERNRTEENNRAPEEEKTPKQA